MEKAKDIAGKAGDDQEVNEQESWALLVILCACELRRSGLSINC